MQPGDIVSYSRTVDVANPNDRWYDLILDMGFVGSEGQECTILGLEDGSIQYVTYYYSEEYRLE